MEQQQSKNNAHVSKLFVCTAVDCKDDIEEVIRLNSLSVILDQIKIYFVLEIRAFVCHSADANFWP